MDKRKLSLVDIIKLIRKKRKLVLYIFLGAFILVSLYNVFAQRRYRSKTTIIPISSNTKNLSSLLSSSGALDLLSGLAGSISSKSYADKFISILKSRIIAESVIESLDLLPEIYPGKWDSDKKQWKNPKKRPLLLYDAIKHVRKKIIRVKETDEGLVQLTVIFKDPKIAQEIASEYIKKLQIFINTNTLSIAKKNRIFLEQQLKLKDKELKLAEEDLKSFQEKNKFINLGAQVEMTLRTAANLKAQIFSKEYQLQMLKKSSGLNTSQSQKIKDEIKELKKQLAKIETGFKKGNKDKNSGITSITDLTELEMRYLRLKREALILAKVYELLIQQYELAKIEEVKDEVSFQLLDKANYPHRKYSPQIILNTVLVLFIAMIISLMTILIIEHIEEIKSKKII